MKKYIKYKREPDEKNSNVKIILKCWPCNPLNYKTSFGEVSDDNPYFCLQLQLCHKYVNQVLIFQLLFPISIKQGDTKLECLSSASVNDNNYGVGVSVPGFSIWQTYNIHQNQENKLTGIILLTLDSKTRLVVLALRMAHVPRME